MLLKGIVASAGRLKNLLVNYYSSMVLLLRGNAPGASFSSLRELQDGSSYQLPITFNGTSRVSSNVKKFGNASIYFDRGTNSYLSCPDDASLNLNNTDWTIEAWIYPFGDYSQNNTIISKRNGATSSCDWQIYLRTSTGVFSFYNGTTYESSVTVPAYQWSHVAAIRQGSVIKLFVNGVEVLLITGNANAGNWPISIGGLTTNVEKFLGYIDSIRVTRGVGRYLTFSGQPTEEMNNVNDSYFDQVSLLLNMNGTDGSTSFIDSSNNNFTFTKAGTTANINTSVKKYGTGAGQFGSGGRITTPNNSAFAFETQDFTIEFWAYRTSTPQFVRFMGNGSQWAIEFGQKTAWSSSAGDGIINVAPPTANQWVFVVFQRRNGIVQLYYDNTLISQNTDNTNFNSTTGTFYLGADTAGSFPYQGYIDDLRITKGVARYGNDKFEVPQSKFENDSSNVGLLINSEISENTSNFLKDSSQYLSEFEMIGNPQSSADQVKFGNGSLFFNGSSSLSTNNNNLILGSDDYVLEAWIYPTTNTIGTIFNQGNGDSGGAFAFFRNSDQKMGFYANNGTRINSANATILVPQNQWTHVALVKNQYRYSIFVNGVLDQTVEGTLYSHTLTPFKIGDGYGGIRYFNGYMDDIKVTRGTTPIINLLNLLILQKQHPEPAESKIPNAIPKNDLILYLGEESDKNFGTQWEDLSGNGYVHYLTSTSFRNSSNVTAVNLTSNGRRLRAYDNNTFTYGPDHTIIVWAKLLPDGKVSDWRTLLRSSPNDHAIIVQNNSNIIGYYDNNTNTFNSYGLNLGALGLENCWVMYTVVGQGGTTSRLFINDGSISGNTLNFNLVGNKHIEVGDHAGSQPFGDVGHVMIYDRALEQSEIKNIFDLLRGRFGATSNNEGLVLHLDSSNQESYSGGLVWKDLSKTMGDVNVQNRSTNWNFQQDPQTGLTCLYNGTNSTYYTAGIDIPLKGFNKLQGTIEMWIKPTDLQDGAQGWFVNADGASFTNTENWLWIGAWKGTTSFIFYFRQGYPTRQTDELTRDTFESLYIQNEWQHYCITWNIGLGRGALYKNGTLIQLTKYLNNSSSFTTAIQDIFPAEIGQIFNGHGRSADNGQFKGYCNTYKIYNRELSAAQVLSNYDSSKSRFDVFLNDLFIHLDAAIYQSYKGFGTLWYNLLGGNANLVNGPTFDSANGGSIAFDGSNDHVTFDNGYAISSISEFSCFMWVYVQSDGTLLTVLGQSAINTGYHHSAIEVSSSGVLSMGLWQGVNALTEKVTTNINFNQWYHVGFTFNGTTLTGYVDGAAFGTTSAFTWAPPSINMFFALMGSSGSNMGTNAYGHGKIGAFYFYKKALSLQEIQDSYNSLENRKNINGEDDNFIIYLDATNSSSYGGSGSTWFDISGNNNNFILSGLDFVSTSPKHFSFLNGSDQAYINNAAFMSGLTEFTFNCWVKLDNASLYSTIVSYAVASIEYTEFNEFLISYEGNAAIPNLTCGWKGNLTTTNVTLSANIWYNITYVFLESKYQIYVNGNFVGENNKTGALFGGGYLVFGQEQDALGGGFSTVQEWEGDMSILQIYDRVLTQQDILEKFYKQRRQFDTFGIV